MEGFMYYVVGQCAPKMYYRFKHHKYRVLLDHLLHITVNSDLFHHRHPSSPPNTSDIAFLHVFRGHRGRSVRDKVMELASDPRWMRVAQVLDVLPKTAPPSTDEFFPELLKLDPQTRPAVFTSLTCREFHLLLCILLIGYRNSLYELDELKSKRDPPNPRELFQRINAICNYLSILHPLVNSAAMKDYCESILRSHAHTDVQDLSREHDTSDTTVQDESDEDSQAHDGYEESEQDSNADDEIGRSPIGRHSASEQYKRWLGLLVAHFNAMDLVLAFVKDVWRDEVTIRLVSTPKPEATLIPWEDLVRDIIMRRGFQRSRLQGEHRLEAHSAWEALSNIWHRGGAFAFALEAGFHGRVHCESFIASMMLSAVTSPESTAFAGVTSEEIQVRPLLSFTNQDILSTSCDSL